MNRFHVLFERLLFRRLLGDGEGTVSVIPASFLTLGLSTLVFTLMAQERSHTDLALLLATTCFLWSGLRTFLEARTSAGDDRDRAVLEPLPIPTWLINATRVAVSAVQLAVGTLNLALPPVVLTGALHGASAGGLLLITAVLSTWTGLAVGQVMRSVMLRVVGAQRLMEWEGPLRLLVAVGLFGVLFAAPDPSAILRVTGIDRAPPFCFALLAVDLTPRRVLIAAGVTLAALALLAVVSGMRERRSSGSRGGRTSTNGLIATLGRRLVRHPELASYEFTLANIARDRTFRARVYPLFAFPFAIIALVASQPAQVNLPLVALFGIPVYVVLAQTFQEFSESELGPSLLAAQPIRDLASFRIGAEKAFLVALLAPIFAAMLAAFVLLATFVPQFAIWQNLGHAVHALLFAILFAAMLFDRHEALAFSQVDRGIYPNDLSGGAFGALALSAAAAVTSVLARDPALFAALTIALLLAIRVVFQAKRRRFATIL